MNSPFTLSKAFCKSTLMHNLLPVGLLKFLTNSLANRVASDMNLPCKNALCVARALTTTNEKPQPIERDAPEKYLKDKNK